MSIEGLSRERWPWRPKPQTDELLSSWLMRIVRDYGMKPHYFCKREWPSVAIWNRDVDKFAPQAVLDGLAVRTGTPAERVFVTTLRAYEGRAFAHWNPNGNTRWILAIGVYHRLHRLPGLQFCPRCLMGDEKPYFRRLWRMGFATVCVIHKIRLSDRCPTCGDPVNFHRVAGPLVPLTCCYRCGTDLREVEYLEAGENCDSAVVDFQAHVQSSLASGWGALSASQRVPIVEYLDVARQLVSILVKPVRQRHLGARLARLMGRTREPMADAWPAVPEKLSVKVRHEALGLVARLFSGWPDGFLTLCRTAGLWKTDLEKDANDLPFWFRFVTAQLR